MSEADKDKLIGILLGKIAGLEAKLDFIMEKNADVLTLPSVNGVMELTLKTMERFEDSYPVIKALNKSF